MKCLQKKYLSMCILGSVNSGKSSLFNIMINNDFSIVTHKKNTTQSIIRGSVVIDDTQLVFFDTPGIHDLLDIKSTRSLLSIVNTVDLILLMIDGSVPINYSSMYFIKHFIPQRSKIIVIINKIDKSSCFRFCVNNLSILKTLFFTQNIFNISTLNRTGIKFFIDYLLDRALIACWKYDLNDIISLSDIDISSEITRKFLLLFLGDEVPFNLRVECDDYFVRFDGSIKIIQSIVALKKSYKSMILGFRGQRIKKISMLSRSGIEKFLCKKVHLFIFVKVS